MGMFSPQFYCSNIGKQSTIFHLCVKFPISRSMLYFNKDVAYLLRYHNSDVLVNIMLRPCSNISLTVIVAFHKMDYIPNKLRALERSIACELSLS